MKTITPRGPLRGVFPVPGSKSLTNRALICAALAPGESTLGNASDSDDTALLINGLNQLGVLTRREENTLRVSGTGGKLYAPKFPIPVGNAGTTFRFLLSVAGLASGTVQFESSERMAERPNEELLAALRALGVDAHHERRPTLTSVVGGTFRGGTVTVAGNRSSQFVSSLLLAAPCTEQGIAVSISGPLVSASYVDLTLEVMLSFGVPVDTLAGGGWSARSGRRYLPAAFAVEPDASGASYPWAAAAITGGEILVPGIGRASLQGDVHFLDVLAAMGAEIDERPEGIRVRGKGELKGVEVDMNRMPDVVPTLAVTALFARGTTRIRNVAHLRHKESDRLAVVAAELRKLGANVIVLEDGLEIHPAPLHGAVVDAHDDHRIAMSSALAGLVVPGVSIDGPDCVRKSFPRFWETLDRLGDALHEEG
jgi:3-phosphoshikimate 1-carboxyvinyltransferase